MSKTIRKTNREPKGLPLTKIPKPSVLVKLKEEWTKPNELQTTVFIGNTINISKLMKFLEKSGVNAHQKQMLRRGEIITVKYNDSFRNFQIVSPESDSGTFRHGKDGLEKAED